eukprot:gene3928-4904_t
MSRNIILISSVLFVIATFFIQNGSCLRGSEGLLTFKPSTSSDFLSSRPDDRSSGWTAHPSDLSPEVVIASDSMKRIIEIFITKRWNKDTNSYVENEYITKVLVSYSLTGFGYVDYGVVDLDITPTKHYDRISFPNSPIIFARSIKVKVLSFFGKPSGIFEVDFEYAPQNIIGSVRSLSPVLYTPLPGGATRVDKIPIQIPTVPYIPSVVMSISALSSSQNTDTMIYVKADNVTTSGFDANFIVWGNSVIWDVVASYSVVWEQPTY